MNSKINGADLYTNTNTGNQYVVPEKPLWKRKTNRATKTRKTKGSKPKRGCDSMRDPFFVVEKKDHSMPPQSSQLDRQRTFEQKQPNLKSTSKKKHATLHSQNRRVLQNQVYYDKVSCIRIYEAYNF